MVISLQVNGLREAGLCYLQKILSYLSPSLPPFISSAFLLKGTCLSPYLCAQTLSILHLQYHTHTDTLRALASLTLRTRALLFCMFLMTFDLRYQSGAHWGLRGVPYCVCLLFASTNPDKELEKQQEQIANSLKELLTLIFFFLCCLKMKHDSEQFSN